MSIVLTTTSAHRHPSSFRFNVEAGCLSADRFSSLGLCQQCGGARAIRLTFCFERAIKETGAKLRTGSEQK